MRKTAALITIISLIGLFLPKIGLAEFSGLSKNVLAKKESKSLPLIQRTSSAKVRPSSIQKSALGNLDNKVKGDVKVKFSHDTTSPHFMFNSDGFMSSKTNLPIKDISDKFIHDNAQALNLSDSLINTLIVSSKNPNSKLKTKQIVYSQVINRIPVFDSYLEFNTTSEGKIINISGHYATSSKATTIARIDSKKAIDIALASAKADIGKLILKPEATKNYYISSGQANLGWKTVIHKNSNERYLIVIDAQDGSVVFRTNLVVFAAQGYYFSKNPAESTLSIASLTGWVNSYYTEGNNVDAHVDWGYPYSPGFFGPEDPSITPTSNDRAYNSGQDFTAGGQLKTNVTGLTYPWLSYALWNNYWRNGDPFGSHVFGPDSFVAVSNLFYQINYLHDWFYNLGFTESAGNFQTNNFGLGGEGGDRVQADSQDQSSYNNANFFTPPDGVHAGSTWGDGLPRMQMFLFYPVSETYDRYSDGSFDGQIITHEFGHGVSTRLVGGPENSLVLNGPQSGAMGEGWSDYWAMTRYNDPVIGYYPTGNATKGMRHYNYSTSPLTYADYGYDGGPEVHNDGEIWAATMWDIEEALGASTARNLIFKGLSLTPPRPTMLDGRDAILSADIADYSGSHLSTLWNIFAARGMGSSASTTDDYTSAANQQIYANYSAPVSDTTAPSGYFSYPINGSYAHYNYSAVIGGRRYYFIHTTVRASDNVGVSKVMFYKGSIFDYVDRLSPFDDYVTSYSNGGSYTLKAYIYDKNLNSRVITTSFRFDNSKPKTYAPYSRTIRPGQRARLYWKVYDRYTGGKSYVTLKLQKRYSTSYRTVKNIRYGLTTINKTRYYLQTFLKRGKYRFLVYARDRARNNQYNIARNYVYVN